MITIIQGEDKDIVVKFEKENGDAYDLSNVTEIEACFKNTDGTTLKKLLTTTGVSIVGGLPQNGKISGRIEETESALLKKSDSADMEVLLDESGDKKIIQFLGQLKVISRVC